MNLSLNQGINVVVALLITPFLFQTLGVEQFGLVDLGLRVILLFGIVVNYGFSFNVPKQLALLTSDQEGKEKLINEVIFTRLWISFVLILLIFVSTQYLGLFGAYSAILLFSTVQLVNDAIYPIFILQGLDRLGWISKTNAIAKLLYVGLVVWVVQSEADAKWVNALLGGTGALVHIVLLIFIYRMEKIRLVWVSLSRVVHRLVDNFQFFSSTIATYVLLNGGSIMLKNFVSEAELGYFSLAQKVALILRMAPVFLTQSILQQASRVYEDQPEEFEGYLKRNYQKGLLITFLLGVVFAFTSKWVVRILAGEYLELSAQLMAILSFLPFIGIFNVSNIIRMLMNDQKRMMARAIWLTTILMLVLGSVGAYYFGSLGMAWALIAAEIFNYWIHRYFLSQTVKTA